MDSKLRVAIGGAVVLSYIVTHLQSKQTGETFSQLEERYSAKESDSREVQDLKYFQRESIRILYQANSSIERIYLLMSLVTLAVIFGA